jgi:two-component system chemotaxis response regulator CheB
MAEPITVLVVDDSAFMRKMLTQMLEQDKRVKVAGVAHDGLEAVQLVEKLKPDVVTMDVEMPGMNGLDALRRIMSTRPTPVIMVSSLTDQGAKTTLEALACGAVDYLPKQLDGVAMNITTIREELLSKVVAAAGTGAKLAKIALSQGVPPSGTAKSTPGTVIISSASVNNRGSKIIAIGCSTGGPQALQEVLPKLPADFPAGILIVQHMPKFFTKPFAERMSSLCRIKVREAKEGDVIEPGVALIAPGGTQCRVARRGATQIIVTLSPNVENHAHAPSADIMIESVAKVYGTRGVGIILTGMGHDGLEGIKALKAAQGRTIAQDESTCIVYGMPKAIVDAKLADKVVPLSLIAGEMANMI